MVSSPVNVNLLDALGLGLGGAFVDVPDDTLVNFLNIASSASVSSPVNVNLLDVLRSSFVDVPDDTLVSTLGDLLDGILGDLLDSILVDLLDDDLSDLVRKYCFVMRISSYISSGSVLPVEFRSSLNSKGINI